MSKKRDFNAYIVQLVEHMRESAENLPDPNVISEFDEESLPEELKMFADVERFLQGKPKRIAVITGIDTQAFPPVSKLNDAHTTILYDEMTRLLNEYGFYADFPAGLPAENKYVLLRTKWNDKLVYTGNGMTCIEFCDYEPVRCPYPEKFCQCKDLDDFDNFDDFDGDDSIF
ncbi:MAG TPA: hypothetical protein VJ915_04960 [Balneolaceae bacterium]|nr:hypothetical protein [Balneolaceae bacterium]